MIYSVARTSSDWRRREVVYIDDDCPKQSQLSVSQSHDRTKHPATRSRVLHHRGVRVEPWLSLHLRQRGIAKALTWPCVSRHSIPHFSLGKAKCCGRSLLDVASHRIVVIVSGVQVVPGKRVAQIATTVAQNGDRGYRDTYNYFDRTLSLHSAVLTLFTVDLVRRSFSTQCAC